MRLIPVIAILAAAFTAGTAAAAPTDIDFARFFGACDAEYGQSTDTAHATGECGIITALVNRFNATNREQITVRTQVVARRSSVPACSPFWGWRTTRD